MNPTFSYEKIKKPIRPSQNKLDVVKVGIIDSDFKSNKNREELKKYGNRIEIIEGLTKNGRGSNHSVLVTSTFFEKYSKFGEKEKIKVAGFTIGYKEEDESFLYAEPYFLRNFLIEEIPIFSLSFGRDTLITDVKNIYDRGRKQELKDPNEKYVYDKILIELHNYRDSYSDLVNKKNKVFVWAAGNMEEPEVGREPGYPLLIPELEKGWVSVVGVNATTKKHFDSIQIIIGDKFYISKKLNSAGAAKNWTISANAFYGWEDIINKEGKKIYIKDKNGVEKVLQSPILGSSFAAPRVSKVLALVKQKYPWMDNNNLRQTIFTTAEDIGEPGVDDEYGWGLLNAEKALKGPAMFDRRLTDLSDNNGRFIANISDKNMISIFENDISGDGGLYKKGDGYLVLAGKNTYEGDTLLETGVLEIEKNTSSPIQVNKNGTLVIDDGATTANIFSDGKAFLGTNTKVNGELELGSLSKLYIRTNEDKKPSVTVSKDFTVKRKDSIGIYDDIKYRTADEKVYTLIDVKGNIKGYTPENLYFGTAIKGAHELIGKQIIAKVRRENMNEYVNSLSSATKSDKNASENIEIAFKKLDSTIKNKDNKNVSERFMSGAIMLQNMNSESYLDATKTTSGEIYASSQLLTLTKSHIVNKTLMDRINNISKNNYENYGINSWVSYIRSNGSIKEQGFSTGKTQLNGFQAGLDTILGEDTVIGISFNKSKLNAKFDKFGGESLGDGIGFSIYGRVEDSNSNFIQGKIGLDLIKYKVERKVLDTESKIKRKDVVTSLYSEGGHDFKLGSSTLTPFLGLEYTRIHRGKFKEENSSWGLSAKSKDYNKSSLIIGFRANYEFEHSTEFKTNINASISHKFNLGNKELDFKAEYSGLSGTEIDIKGINLSKSTTWIGIGINSEWGEQFSINANLNTKFEKRSFNDKVFTLGASYRF